MRYVVCAFFFCQDDPYQDLQRLPITDRMLYFSHIAH
jgi:hypothetical protein